MSCPRRCSPAAGYLVRAAILLLACTAAICAASPVYVVLWFDTEDYIEPAADDAALRIANDLTALGVRATFKVVGEKARALESRGRTDVIRALSKHAIGYHSNYHSLHPAPAEYLRTFGYLEGAREFERREAQGVADLRRIFGITPVCYGQPGSSWAPQTNLALRRMGISVYLDEGDQVGLNDQPFWYGGMLYVFHMGQNQFRARLDRGSEDREAYARFDAAARRLAANGGGVISIYYHPTEFVTTEFWDAVNFSGGRMPAPPDWKRPNRRSPEDSERAYGVLRQFVAHMKQAPGVSFVTAQDLPQIYQSALPRPVDKRAIAGRLRARITFLETAGQSLSPADMLIALLGLEPQIVDGPTARGVTTYAAASVDRTTLERAAGDAADFIRRNHRLPNQVFLGAETLSLPDFAATFAQFTLEPATTVPIVKGNVDFDRYFSNDPRKSFSWVIHPEGFAAPELLELGRLQGWTLKPAKFR
jgi:hypothetical protein